MSDPRSDWRPSATPERLRVRAALLARARAFFAARDVLEVDTPVVVNAPVSDLHIHAAAVTLAPASGVTAGGMAGGDRRALHCFLHTSPEYAMKRLLAAGSGDIYQICHVVRSLEHGRLHNPEFTLIEWYRVGFTLAELMDEVEALVRQLLGGTGQARVSERISYRDVFMRELGLDPLVASVSELAQAAAALGPGGALGATAGEAARDAWLELLMGALIGPRLGCHGLTFVHGYPASQAALARLHPEDARIAQRFELYCEGLELANGFHELSSAAEQRARFARDNEQRHRAGLAQSPPDERLLAALEVGLPECAGVALGFDRLVMLATGAVNIDEVLPFPTARA